MLDLNAACLNGETGQHADLQILELDKQQARSHGCNSVVLSTEANENYPIQQAQSINQWTQEDE